MADSWFVVFRRQTLALLKKNFLLFSRNRATTCAQMFIGFFFCLCLLVMQVVIDSNNEYNEAFVETVNPTLDDARYIVPCISHTQSCRTFVFAPNDTVSTAVATEAARVGGLPSVQDSEFGIKGFASEEDMNSWIGNNPNTTQMAVIFKNPGLWNRSLDDGNNMTNVFEYVLELNETKICRELGVFKCSNPWLDLRIPVQTAIDSALVRIYGDSVANAEIRAQISDFPHPDLPISFYVMDEYGADFFYMVLVFSFVVQIVLVVTEKEKKLRDSMRQMGMIDSAYWVSWHIVFTVTNTIMVLLLILCGAILQLEFFLENNFFVYFFMLWLTAQAFTSFALFVAAFFRKTESARNFALLFFILSMIASSIITELLYLQADDAQSTTRRIFGAIPSIPFYVGMTILNQRSVGKTATGMSWSEIGDSVIPPKEGEVDTWSMQTNFDFLFASWILYAVAAWYVDNVAPNVYGRRESFLFPIYRLLRLCRGSDSAGVGQDALVASARSRHQALGKSEDSEVERDTQAALKGDASAAVRILGLVKQYEDKKAVNNVCYAVKENSCFVLLGHNGAGKSTTLNMLTGNISASEGDAFVFGLSVTHQMDKIRSFTGVCPQHDILWDQLTGREHLQLFAHLKGISDGNVNAEVESRLSDVLLTQSGDELSSSYSGGMLRRLSLAVALIANPRIVFLDEPTTGMDPVTRREVWDMIQRAKQQRVIILTTHSMEEADVLGDRVGIMSHGRMQAAGTPLRLKRRFGGGFRLSMFMDRKKGSDAESSDLSRISKFIEDRVGVGSTQLVQHVEDSVLFRVDTPSSADDDAASKDTKNDTTPTKSNDQETKMSEHRMVTLFRDLETSRDDLGIKEFSIGLPSLEQVFLELSHRESAKEKNVDGSDHSAVTISKASWKDGERRRRRRVTYAGQVRALCCKNMRYQCTHKCQLCCMIFFPVLIMALMLLLDKLIFEKYRIEALCGEGVSLDNCKEDGIDLECVADQFKKTYESNPVAHVGMISDFYRGRKGINPNCNADMCFEDLEQKRWDAMKFSTPNNEAARNAIGSVSYAPSQSLSEWHLDYLMWGLEKEYCDNNYDNYFECSGGGASEQLCYDLRNARDWNNVNNALARDAGIGGGPENVISGTGACMPNAQTGQVEAPSAYILSQLQQIEYERTQCFANYYRRLSDHFAWPESGIDLRTEIMDAVRSRNVSGDEDSVIGSHYTSATVEDDVMRSMAYEVAALAFNNQSGTVHFDVTAMMAAVVANELNVATLFTAPSMNLLCFVGCNETNADGNYDRDSGCPFWPAITTLTESIDATESMCLYLQRIDAVRGAAFFGRSDEGETNRDIYDAWYGVERTTPQMENNEDYRQHFYLSDWTARAYSAVDSVSGAYEYVTYYNNSALENRPGWYNWIYAVWQVDDGIVRKHTGRGVRVLKRTFPREFQCNRDEWIDSPLTTNLECDLLWGPLRFSILDFAMINFMPLILLLMQFIIVGAIVYEKANRLRMVMKMMGLKSTVYWLVNYTFYYSQYSAMIVIMWIFGIFANVQSFRLHDPSVLFLIFFMWGHVLIATSFLLSVFFSSPRSATVVALLILVLSPTVGGAIFYQMFNSEDTPSSAFTPFMLYPPWIMLRCVYWICLSGAFREPITRENWRELGDGALPESIGWMFAWWIFSLVALWYCEQVIVVGYGSAREPLFFLRRSYWSEILSGRKSVDDIDDEVIPKATDADKKIFKDVDAERIRAFDEKAGNIAVRVLGLRKEFPSATKGAPPKVAVNSVSLAVNKNACLALLGHNGAGKTTLINMLTGLFSPSRGTALYAPGENLLSINRDLPEIYGTMGVCPQHDVVWETLSATDHLRFYGRLKGFEGSALGAMVRDALRSVNLERDAHKPVGQFSGGMKRRLSCAMSLIGVPTITYLDEPSTGLDPASRRSLWDVISAAKGDKSIVLTTHSMEEADVLSDRIAIMSHGEIQCVGTASALKRRFGRGYTLTISTADRSDAGEKRLHDFVYRMFPTAKLLQEPIGGTSKFEVARAEVVLSKVFEAMSDPQNRSDVGFVDWGFTETTLEEVFLKIAALSKLPDSAKLKRTLSDLAQDVTFVDALVSKDDADSEDKRKRYASASEVDVSRPRTPPSKVVPLEMDK